jgi:broad specificity polyphosphatase/5'/3'-nucleotidase SurE
MSGSSTNDDGTKQSGLEELAELIRESPPWSKQYVVVKFQNTKPITIGARNLLHYLRRDEEGYGDYDGDVEYFGARLTPSNNISMRKPLLSEWESAAASDGDHIEILREIGIEDYYHV